MPVRAPSTTAQAAMSRRHSRPMPAPAFRRTSLGLAILVAMGTSGCAQFFFQLFAKQLGHSFPVVDPRLNYQSPKAGVQAGQKGRLDRPQALAEASSFGAFVPHAAFLGNQTVLIGGVFAAPNSPSFSVLVRESNCSLTLGALSNITESGSTLIAQLPDADRQLRVLAGLTGAGSYSGGCSPRAPAALSAPVRYLGRVGGAGGDALSAWATTAGSLYLQRVSPQGTPVSRTVLATLAAPGIVAADLNGDGITDLVSPYLTVAGVSSPGVFLGRADGSFASPTIYPVLGSDLTRFNTDAVVADVNGDGRPDILVRSTALVDGSYTGRLVSLLNTGNGGFSTGPVRELSSVNARFVVADVNGDGRPDVLTTEGQLLYGNGDGSFAAPVVSFRSAIGLRALAVGDLNGDGRPDLAGITFGTNPFVSIYLANASGGFDAGDSYASLKGSFNLSIGDVDGDGRADVVVGLVQAEGYGPDPDASGATQYLLGRGDGTLIGAQAMSGFDGHAVADLDGDGFPDLVRPAPGPGLPNQDFVSPGLELRRGSSTGRFGGPVALPGLNFQARKLVIGDVDGDGRADIVATGSSAAGNRSGLAVQRGLGSGRFAAPVYTTPAGVLNEVPDIAIGDFNGDGRADVVLIHRDTGAPERGSRCLCALRPSRWRPRVGPTHRRWQSTGAGGGGGPERRRPGRHRPHRRPPQWRPGRRGRHPGPAHLPGPGQRWLQPGRHGATRHQRHRTGAGRHEWGWPAGPGGRWPGCHHGPGACADGQRCRGLHRQRAVQRVRWQRRNHPGPGRG